MNVKCLAIAAVLIVLGWMAYKKFGGKLNA